MRVHCTLTHYCNVIAGQSPVGSSYNSDGIGMEFHQGKKAFGDYILEQSGIWTTEPTKIAEPQDILMSVRAPVGPTNITNRKICIGRGLAAIRCRENACHRFILYALKHIESNIVGNNGAVFNSINKKDIEKLPVPSISLVEQQEIVDYLDKAFAKIDALKKNAEQQLSDAKALFSAALEESMSPKKGWDEKTLRDIVVIKHGKDYKDIPNNRSKYPVYGSGEEVIAYVDEFSCNANTIILGRKGTIDKPRFVDHEYWNIDTAFSLSSKDGYSIKYIYYFTLTVDWKSLNSGSAKPSLTQTLIYDQEISVPSLPEQQTIVAHLDALSSKVNQLQENYNKILRECDALKQALLREIFE